MASLTNTIGYTFVDGEVLTAAKFVLLGVPTISAGYTYAFGDGSAAAPAITFNSDSDNGFYYIGANNFGIACSGATVGNFSTTGLNNCVIGATTPLAGNFTTITTTSVTAATMTAATPCLRFVGTTATQTWISGDAGATGGTAGHFVLYDVTNSKNVMDTAPNGGAVAITSTALTTSGTLTVTGAFGCNGKTAQTAAVSGGLLSGVITALIANGILSS